MIGTDSLAIVKNEFSLIGRKAHNNEKSPFWRLFIAGPAIF
jgi:hypothetical protein